MKCKVLKGFKLGKCESRKFYNIPVGGCFKYSGELYIRASLSCVNIGNGIIQNFDDHLEVLYFPDAKVVC